MKKFIFVLFVMFLPATLGFSTLAHATLVDNGTYNGGNLIYDDDLGITWYDAPATIPRYWDASVAWAASLTVGNTIAGTWRLPTTPVTSPGYTNEGEMGHLYYDELQNVAGGPLANKGLFSNLQSNLYWSGTDAAPYYGYAAWGFAFGLGHQGANPKDSLYGPAVPGYALAVHEGNVVGAHVSEPTTLLLLGLGLIGLAGARRKIIN